MAGTGILGYLAQPCARIRSQTPVPGREATAPCHSSETSICITQVPTWIIPPPLKDPKLQTLITGNPFGAFISTLLSHQALALKTCFAMACATGDRCKVAGLSRVRITCMIALWLSRVRAWNSSAA